MADEAENNVDESQSFEVTTSDIPEPQAQEESQSTEEQASSEGGEAESSEESTSTEEAVIADSSVDDKGVEQKSGDDTAADSQSNKPQKGVNKRIGKLVKQREEGKRENEGLKREIAELKGEKSTDSNSDVAIVEPVEKDFETYGDYLDALDVHEKNVEAAPAKEAEKKTDTKSTSNDDPELSDSQKTALAVINESVKDAEDIPEDFEKVALADDVQVTGEMIEAIAECEDPAKVMYHLGKNKDLASEISKSTSIQQVKAIDNIDRTVVKPPKPVKLTKVNDTIDPVKGSDFQGKTLDEMSFAEFEKHENGKSKETDGW